jgi:hypothetical protein
MVWSSAKLAARWGLPSVVAKMGLLAVVLLSGRGFSCTQTDSQQAGQEAVGSNQQQHTTTCLQPNLE